ncbi:Saccharopine dehydrogenase-domain-containing protein [Massariosphaeria phaeospora]|uniref:Saccharopine dehydrogenase-domain-containing protein n=1 Tax=Massariosphaeria phaeospora TaxID=100035 RepID=A0A7C8HZN3_9PLEO|nr:Saccharopine dehydrogenase-domain-containing protein [Massariosphaeria phaeospora]
MAQEQEPRHYDLILFGATGYTGKLTAEWISTHLSSNLTWAIAGRNPKKLQSVADELTRLNPSHQQPAIEVCELSKDKLLPLIRTTRLVITTIGPYMLYGEPLLAACAESGTHYLDCTGEVPWIHEMLAKYESTAQRTGAILIPECGLDSVPADMLTYALTRHMRKTFDKPTSSVVLTLYDFKSGISGGTASTFLNLFSHYSLRHLATSMHPYSLSPVPTSNPSPPPQPSPLHRALGVVSVPELGGIQTVGVMASVDTCIVHRSWGLYQTAADPSLAYGPHFRFSEYSRPASLLRGSLFRLGITLTTLLLAFPLTRWLLSPLLTRFVIPAAGDGPQRASMTDDYMHYRGVGYAEMGEHSSQKGPEPQKVIGNFYSPHGGYLTTALTLTAAADLLLNGDVQSSEAGRVGGGIFTPAMLGDAYVRKLGDFGMKIEVEKA